MKNRYLGIAVCACLLLVALGAHIIFATGAKGGSVYALVFGSFILAYMIARSNKKKKNVGVSGRRMAAYLMALVGMSFASSVLLPQLIALAVVSASVGVSHKYFMHALKNAALGKEGI